MEEKNSRINNNSYLVDRISALPDFILGVIVSFLPTKNAVATSILSQRWKLVWTTLHNLDFCYDGRWTIPGKDTNMEFIRFVNRVLLLHDGGSLNEFCLDWRPRCIPSDATSWISFAITRNVEELFLLLGTCVGLFDMPMSVFRCDSLRSLALHDDISVSSEIVVWLPKLERLVLESVYFESNEAFEKLISGCPVLYYLYLDMHPEEYCTYTISSTSLKRLELDITFEYSLILEASSLEYLKLDGYISEISVRKGLRSLVAADFNTLSLGDEFSQADVCNSIVELVREFDCAKALILSADVMWAFNVATIRLSTKFKRLMMLETRIYCCYCNSLLDFLQSSDNLECLAIYKDFLYQGKSDVHDHSKWTAPVEVPMCLSNSLTAVVIVDYKGLEDEREILRYLLEHGGALEVVQIYCGKKDGNGSNFDLMQEIREFPRKSLTCEIQELATPLSQERVECVERIYTFLGID